MTLIQLRQECFLPFNDERLMVFIWPRVSGPEVTTQ
jgi:hypothetical protein